MSTTTDLVRPLLRRFESRRPIRAGSLIVTLYGDAIAPRGGSLWLGSLNALVAPFGIEPGLVRTAMSRLVAEGWFERNRVGKNSYYRLSKRGAGEFVEAGERIYRALDPPWDGRMRLAVLSEVNARRRAAQREQFAARGFGQLAPNVMVHHRAHAADDCDGAISLTATVEHDADAARRLAAACWRLDDLSAAYQALLRDLAPLASGKPRPEQLGDDHVFQLRVLLVHEWRRIVLHDPQLPAALLPRDWPGTHARELVARIYRASTPGCERWLDDNAVNEKGALPPAGKSAAGRFRLGPDALP